MNEIRKKGLTAALSAVEKQLGKAPMPYMTRRLPDLSSAQL